MENSNIIENDTKVLDFMAMTETGDPEVAKKYLESAKWDVTTAVNAFYSKINVNNNAQRNNININNNNNALNRNLNNNQNNNEEDDGFLNKYIISPISSVFNAIFGSCKEKRDIEREEEERIFRPLPSKIYDSYKFCQFITRKIGIIVFYTANDVHFLNNFISQVSRNSMIMNLLRQYFVLYPLLANTNDGYKMQNAISDSQLKFPSFVFCRNGSFDQNDDVYKTYRSSYSNDKNDFLIEKN